MSYRGTGIPVLVTKKGERIDLPTPSRGRDERFIEDYLQYTTPTGSIRRGRKRYRFEATYRFEDVNQIMMNRLSVLSNSNEPVTLVPHVDFPYFQVLCDFIDMQPQLWQGWPGYDEIVLSFRSVQLLERRPDLDSLVGGMRITRVGVINLEALQGA